MNSILVLLAVSSLCSGADLNHAHRFRSNNGNGNSNGNIAAPGRLYQQPHRGNQQFVQRQSQVQFASQVQVQPQVEAQPQFQVLQPQIEEQPQFQVFQPQIEEQPQFQVLQPQIEEQPQFQVFQPQVEEQPQFQVLQPQTEEQPLQNTIFKFEERPQRQQVQNTVFTFQQQQGNGNGNGNGNGYNGNNGNGNGYNGNNGNVIVHTSEQGQGVVSGNGDQIQNGNGFVELQLNEFQTQSFDNINREVAQQDSQVITDVQQAVQSFAGSSIENQQQEQNVFNGNGVNENGISVNNFNGNGFNGNGVHGNGINGNGINGNGINGNGINGNVINGNGINGNGINGNGINGNGINGNGINENGINGNGINGNGNNGNGAASYGTGLQFDIRTENQFASSIGSQLTKPAERPDQTFVEVTLDQVNPEPLPFFIQETATETNEESNDETTTTAEPEEESVTESVQFVISDLNTLQIEPEPINVRQDSFRDVSASISTRPFARPTITVATPRKIISSSHCGEGLLADVNGDCVEPHITRNVYLYAAPPRQARTRSSIKVPKPKLEYNIVFVRNPEESVQSKPVVIPPPQRKTLVYVLNKKSELEDAGLIEAPSHPVLQPEVFFVNYNDGENPELPGGIDLSTALREMALEGRIIGDIRSEGSNQQIQDFQQETVLSTGSFQQPIANDVSFENQDVFVGSFPQVQQEEVVAVDEVNQVFPAIVDSNRPTPPGYRYNTPN